MVENPNDVPAQLRQLVEGLEALNDELNNVNQRKRATYKMARKSGFNTNAIKHVLAIRRVAPRQWMENEQMMAYYLRLLAGPHQAATHPTPELDTATDLRLPEKPEDAHKLGFEAGTSGKGEDANPYEDPDLREAWDGGWQRGVDNLAKAYVDDGTTGADQKPMEGDSSEGGDFALPDSVAHPS